MHAECYGGLLLVQGVVSRGYVSISRPKWKLSIKTLGESKNEITPKPKETVASKAEIVVNSQT